MRWQNAITSVNPLTFTDGTHVSDTVTDTRLNIPCVRKRDEGASDMDVRM